MRDKSNKAAPGGRPWYQTVGSKVWYFFNSLKLTLGLLITLSVVSIIGTVIEQNLRPGDYVQSYGLKWAKFIIYSGIDNMYHAWWFTVLLVFLVLNIIVCTFERFPPKWKSLLRQKPSKAFAPRIIDNCSHNQTLQLSGSPDEAKDRVVKVLKKKKYKIAPFSTEDGHCLFAWKGTIGRFGSDVVHISLLLILLGAIVGGIYGYKDMKVVYVGDSMEIPEADFKVRLDKFWIDFYDTGQIKQYNSVLTVTEGDREVLQKQIWVNEPLYYKGVRFYQSSYGAAWDRVEQADIGFLKKESKGLSATTTLKWGEEKPIPDTDYTIKLVGYAADFAYDERTKTVFSQSMQADNPAINLEVYRKGEMIANPWLFLKYPGIFPAIPDSEDDIVFAGYRGIMFSGISLNKDPGTNIVWLGAIVMGIGFILAFFIFHRRVWVYLKETEGSTEVRIGGLINKNQFALEKELKDIVDELQS